ncbi:hypothetical protein Bcep1808_7515 (plasmid) [Burkholderia vietnamiensis G4]|uniref:Uncharacterized protein n=1 Tax=Burkholderia vietnamiensis (strain G4 / LMG 22486) TaxID=269482 RepID=A4JVT7_BURVG|nr:hypothetical protein Bcep1808_7515 [Burkholderia vietnamiensis G4]
MTAFAIVFFACSRTLSGQVRRLALSGAARYAFHVDKAIGNACPALTTSSASACVIPAASISARSDAPLSETSLMASIYGVQVHQA